MANPKIRISLKAYDHKLIDQSAAQIIETCLLYTSPSQKENRCTDQRPYPSSHKEGSCNNHQSGA